jgi:hypothetical protein
MRIGKYVNQIAGRRISARATSLVKNISRPRRVAIGAFGLPSIPLQPPVIFRPVTIGLLPITRRQETQTADGLPKKP